MAPPTVPRIRLRPKARNGTLQFFWTTPISDGGSALTAYLLECSAISYSQTIAPNLATYLVDSLTNGTDYTFTLKAQNADGDSPVATFRTVQPGNFPGPTQSASVLRVNPTTALLNWSAPASTGGADIRYYVAHARNQTNPGYPILKRSIYPNVSSKYFGGLDASSVYIYNLYSVNDPGYSIPAVLYEVPSDPDLVVLLRAILYSGSGAWTNEADPSKNATLENGTIAKNGSGNGIVLNGSTNWVLPPIGSLSHWTINAWFKQTGPAGDAGCIVTDIYAGGAYVNYSILMNALGASTTQVIGGFFTSGWYMESTVDDWTNWKNIQLTWDGTNLTTYINGSFYHQINHVGVISGGDNVGVRVGRRWDAPEYVTGEIGEVRIYSRALTAGEVSEAYAQSAPFFAA